MSKTSTVPNTLSMGAKTELLEAASESGEILVRKVPGWGAGMALVILAMFGGLWLIKEPIQAIMTNKVEIDNLKARMDENASRCLDVHKRQEAQISTLLTENSELKSRVARLETRIPMPIQ